MKIHKEFPECPVCGSKERLLETLAQDLKDRGLASKDWDFHYDSRQGVVIEQKSQHKMLIGAKIPAYHINTDICMACGCVYATSFDVGEATITAKEFKPNIQTPRQPGNLPLGIPPIDLIRGN